MSNCTEQLKSESADAVIEDLEGDFDLEAQWDQKFDDRYHENL